MNNRLYKDVFNIEENKGFITLLNNIDSELVSGFTDDVETCNEYLEDMLGNYIVFPKRTPEKLVKMFYLNFVKYLKYSISLYENQQYYLSDIEKTTTQFEENKTHNIERESILNEKINAFDSENLIDNSNNDNTENTIGEENRDYTITTTREKNIDDLEKRIDNIKKMYIENNILEIIKDGIKKLIVIDIE